MDWYVKTVVVLFFMVVSYPLFEWLFPYNLIIRYDEIFGWQFRLERKDQSQ